MNTQNRKPESATLRPKGRIRPRRKRPSDRLISLLPALLLAGFLLSVVYPYDLGERTVLMRYLLFALSALVAFVVPYIAFPDPNARLWQLANLPPGRLMREYLSRQQMVWGTGLILILVTSLADLSGTDANWGAQSLLALQGILFFSGIWLYSASRYLQVGRDSQQWLEGEKGRRVRHKFAEIAKYPIDPGSVPSLVTTILVALTGMMAVVVGAIGYTLFGAAGELAIAILLLLFGSFRLLIASQKADQNYYQTHAFYSEFFGEASGPDGDRQPLHPDQLWWIPVRWRSLGWGLSLQMDRKLPAGRIVLIGHLFLWLLVYQDAAHSVMWAAWIFFALLHQGLLMLTVHIEIAPKWWMRLMAPPFSWAAARFLVQLRWLLPLMVSLLAMNALFVLFSWSEIGWIAAAYLLSSAAVASALSLRHERAITH